MVTRTPPLTSHPFQRPVRVMNCPETVEERNRPPIIGIVMTPDMVGDLSRASWKYWLKKTVPVNIATPTKSEARDASVMVRLRNSRSGMIGSLAFASTSTKTAPRMTEPPTITYVCHETQSYLSPAKVTQISSSETAAATKVALPVDLDVPLQGGQVQGLLQHDQRDDRERHTDVEAPAPAEPRGVGDDTAEQRAADGRDGEGRAEVAGEVPRSRGRSSRP